MYKNYLNKFTVLDENFLSLDDCLIIKSKVFDNKNYWQNPDKHNQISFFPFGMYSTSIENYKKDVIIYKNIMNTLFDNYYIKLLVFLNNLLQIKIKFHDNLHYPGFHISNNKPMLLPNFHVDRFSNLTFFLNREEAFYFNNPKIFSVIIIINSLKKDSGLLLRKKNLPSTESKSLHFDESIEYKTGMLAMWDGEIQHSIKPFVPLDNDDIRLTMQCHIAIANNQGIIFW